MLFACRPSLLIAAVDGDRQGRANLAHPFIAEAAQPFDQDSGGDALDGVEIDSGSLRDRVISGFEYDFAGEAANSGGAGSYQRAPQSRDGGVT